MYKAKLYEQRPLWNVFRRVKRSAATKHAEMRTFELTKYFMKHVSFGKSFDIFIMTEAKLQLT